MSWFYWFGKSNNKSNYLEDVGAENPRVLSQESFDELNYKLEVMTFERDGAEALLSDVRDNLTDEQNENKKLRNELSKALIKLMTIEAVLLAKDFNVVEESYSSTQANEGGPWDATETVGTDDIINGLADLSGLPEVEDLNLNTHSQDNESNSY